MANVIDESSVVTGLTAIEDIERVGITGVDVNVIVDEVPKAI